jgi:hypothetical protein
VGLGAPLLAAVAWAVFVNPHGSRATEDPVRLALELLIFGSGVAALAASGRPRPALVFGALVAIHLALTFVLDQR